MSEIDFNKEIHKNTKIIFSVNTKRDYFIDWLAEKTIFSSNPHLRKALSKLPNKRFSDGLKMAGVLPEETHIIEIGNFKNLEGKVFFKITTIGENRIEVYAGFTQNAFIVFSSILAIIAGTYHEASDIIWDYLKIKPHPEKESSVIDIGGNVTGSVVVTGSNNVINVNQNRKSSEEQNE